MLTEIACNVHIFGQDGEKKSINAIFDTGSNISLLHMKAFMQTENKLNVDFTKMVDRDVTFQKKVKTSKIKY